MVQLEPHKEETPSRLEQSKPRPTGRAAAGNAGRNIASNNQNDNENISPRSEKVSRRSVLFLDSPKAVQKPECKGTQRKNSESHDHTNIASGTEEVSVEIGEIKANPQNPLVPSRSDTKKSFFGELRSLQV